MTAKMLPNLIVISGPIGAGKSSIGKGLADRCTRSGSRAGVVDLDLVWKMISAWPPSREDWKETLRIARRAAATLANTFVEERFKAVVIEGDFWNDFSQSDFLALLAGDVAAHFVTLTVSYEHALRRVQGELSRGISRDRAFLKRNNDAFHEAMENATAGHLVLDTDNRDIEDLVDELWNALIEEEGGGYRYHRPGITGS